MEMRNSILIERFQRSRLPASTWRMTTVTCSIYSGKEEVYLSKENSRKPKNLSSRFSKKWRKIKQNTLGL